MILAVKPIHESTLNCFESIIATLASWWKRDYMLTFAESWGFEYIPKSQNLYALLGNRINSGKGSTNRFLERYHGIQVVEHKPKSAREVVDIARGELDKKKPACIFIDSFWCSWNPAYQKYHFAHYCLAVGFDVIDGSLLCIDPFYLKSNERLCMDDLEHGYGKCMTFEIRNGVEIGDGWRDIVENAVFRVQGIKESRNAFEAMRSFADEIIQSINLEREIEEFTDLKFAPIFLMLSYVSWARINFAQMLEYLANQCNVKILLELSKDMKEAGAQWGVIKAMLIKAAITHKQDHIKKVSQMIKEVAIYEESLSYEFLKKLCLY